MRSTECPSSLCILFLRVWLPVAVQWIVRKDCEMIHCTSSGYWVRQILLTGSLTYAQPASRSRQSEAVHIIYLDNNHPALTANRRGYIELVGVDLRSPFNCQLQHLASTRLLRHPYLLSYSVSPSVWRPSGFQTSVSRQIVVDDVQLDCTAGPVFSICFCLLPSFYLSIIYIFFLHQPVQQHFAWCSWGLLSFHSLFDDFLQRRVVRQFLLIFHLTFLFVGKIQCICLLFMRINILIYMHTHMSSS